MPMISDAANVSQRQREGLLANAIALAAISGTPIVASIALPWNMRMKP